MGKPKPGLLPGAAARDPRSERGEPEQESTSTPVQVSANAATQLPFTRPTTKDKGAPTRLSGGGPSCRRNVVAPSVGQQAGTNPLI